MTSKDKISSWPVLQFQTLRRRHLRWALSLIYPLTENEFPNKIMLNTVQQVVCLWYDLPSAVLPKTTPLPVQTAIWWWNRTVTNTFRKLPKQKPTRRDCVLTASWNFPPRTTLWMSTFATSEQYWSETIVWRSFTSLLCICK